MPQTPQQLRWNWGPCCLWFCCIKWYMHECTSLMPPAIMWPQISDNAWNSGLTSLWSRAFLLQWILLMHSAWHKSSVGPLHCFFPLIQWGDVWGRRETETQKDSGRAGIAWEKDRPSKKGVCRADLGKPEESMISETGKWIFYEGGGPFTPGLWIS